MIRAHFRPAPLLLYKDYEDVSSAPFYAGERLAVVASRSRDLRYGERTPDAAGWFPSRAILASPEHFYLLASRAALATDGDTLAALGLCPVVIAPASQIFTNDATLCGLAVRVPAAGAAEHQVDANAFEPRVRRRHAPPQPSTEPLTGRR